MNNFSNVYLRVNFHLAVNATDDPCHLNYPGDKVFSEPETRALRDFMLSHKGQMKSYVALHSKGCVSRNTRVE